MMLRWLLLVVLLSASSGCQLALNATRNVTAEVRESTGGFTERMRNRRLAADAWTEYAHAHPGAGIDFALGFKEGYADHLEFGGRGEPPVLPPPRYRSVRFQTPQGYQAIEDWFAGFRLGAEIAHAGGQRQWMTLPTSITTAAEPVILIETKHNHLLPAPKPSIPDPSQSLKGPARTMVPAYLSSVNYPPLNVASTSNVADHADKKTALALAPPSPSTSNVGHQADRQTLPIAPPSLSLGFSEPQQALAQPSKWDSARAPEPALASRPSRVWAPRIPVSPPLAGLDFIADPSDTPLSATPPLSVYDREFHVLQAEAGLEWDDNDDRRLKKVEPAVTPLR